MSIIVIQYQVHIGNAKYARRIYLCEQVVLLPVAQKGLLGNTDKLFY